MILSQYGGAKILSISTSVELSILREIDLTHPRPNRAYEPLGNAQSALIPIGGIERKPRVMLASVSSC